MTEFLDRAGVASALNVSRRTVERWESEKRIEPTSYTPSGRSRYSVDYVESLKACRGKPVKSPGSNSAAPGSTPAGTMAEQPGPDDFRFARKMRARRAVVSGRGSSSAKKTTPPPPSLLD